MIFFVFSQYLINIDFYWLNNLDGICFNVKLISSSFRGAWLLKKTIHAWSARN